MSKRKSPSKFNAQDLLDKMPPPTPQVSNERTKSRTELEEIFKNLNFDYSSQQGKLKTKQTQTTPEAKSNIGIGRSLGFDSHEDEDEEERQGVDTPIRPKALIAEKGSLTFLGGRKTKRKKRRRKTTRKKRRRKTKKRKKLRIKRKTKRRRR